MRVSSNCHCSKSCGFSTLSVCSCLPCLRVSKAQDCVQNVLSSPSHVDVVLERKLSGDGKVGVEQNEEEDAKVENFLKSSLKKPGEPKSGQAAKGNVKWMDLLGKELVEIKEFETIDSEELEDSNNNTACMCTIQ